MSKVLLLGMYYGKEDVKPTRGQCFRDRIRCKAIESLGYEAYTLDDKHCTSIAVDGRHCKANFSDCRRMGKSISAIWPIEVLDKGFDVAILDYFFSPAGWTAFRWTDNFFRHSLPYLAEKNIICEGGLIWLPHVDHVHKMMEKYRLELEEHFIWQSVHDPTRNPLFRATDNVVADLRKCPDNMTNETQLRPLLANDDHAPFYILERVKRSEVERRRLAMISPSERTTTPQRPTGVPGRTTRSGTVFSTYTVESSASKKRKPQNIWATKSRKRAKTNVAPTSRLSTSSSSSSSKKSRPSLSFLPKKAVSLRVTTGPVKSTSPTKRTRGRPRKQSSDQPPQSPSSTSSVWTPQYTDPLLGPSRSSPTKVTLSLYPKRTSRK